MANSPQDGSMKTPAHRAATTLAGRLGKRFDSKIKVIAYGRGAYGRGKYGKNN